MYIFEKLNKMKKFIAIVGPIASGKTTAAKFLAENGYEHRRLNEGIYEEADKQGLDRENREHLQDVGDKLREERGVAVLADMVIQKIQEEYDGEKKYVIESIRNHNELLAMEEAFEDSFYVIAVDAPVETRFERAVEREGQYKEQDMTFELFKKISDRELGEGNAENEQNVLKCMEMAHVVIENTGDLETLHKKVLEEIMKANRVE